MPYHISQTNTLVTCPDSITLFNRPIGSAGVGGEQPGSPQGPRPPEPAAASQPNTLRLNLKPIGTGIYPTRVLLTSQYDTRVVDLELTAQTMTQVKGGGGGEGRP